MLKVSRNKIKLTRGDTAYLKIELTDENGNTFEPAEGDKVYFRSTKEILRYNGSTWIVVTSIGSGIKSFSGRGKVQGTAPGGSMSTSEQYLNTTTAKLHNGTDDGGWDDGVEVSEGFSFYSDSDYKIYTYKDSQFISTDLEDKELLFNTNDKVLYIHYLNGNVHDLYRVDHSKLTVIRETVDAFLLSGKEISLKKLDTMYLDEVQVFVSGLLQMPGVDYEINQYNMLSWKNFALKDIIKMGDVITVYYMMQA